MKNRFDDKFFNNKTNIKKNNNQIKNHLKSYKYIYNILFSKKFSNSENKSYKNKFDRTIINKDVVNKIILKNINKYNASKHLFNKNIMNNFIGDKATHKKTFLKDYIIFNDNTEYLKGFYKHKEMKKIFPKFYIYYKNYFKFFLKPTLSDLKFCHFLKKNGDKHAKCFYEEYKNKNRLIKNRNNKILDCKKKILKTNILEEKDEQSSLIFSRESINNQDNINSDFSTISLLSIINLINNNKNITKLDKEKDFIKKKMNLFLEFKKDNNLTDKSQKSTAVLTPTTIHNVKIINNYKGNNHNKMIKPKIKNEVNNINNIKKIFNKNKENNDLICLSERNNTEKNYKKNFKNIITNIKSTSKKNISNAKDGKKNIINNNYNTDNKNYYNMKKVSYSPMNKNLFKKATQMSGYKLNDFSGNDFNSFLNQTQIKKVTRKIPTFRENNSKKCTNIIKSKNIKYNNILNYNNNKNNNTFKVYYNNRNDLISNSFIYYQKVKRENNAK